MNVVKLIEYMVFMTNVKKNKIYLIMIKKVKDDIVLNYERLLLIVLIACLYQLLLMIKLYACMVDYHLSLFILIKSIKYKDH